MDIRAIKENHRQKCKFLSRISQDLKAADFFKKESRSPRGFLPETSLLRAHESVAPPPLPQKNSGGAHHFRFLFLDLCIRFGKIISKACEGFNSGAQKAI